MNRFRTQRARLLVSALVAAAVAVACRDEGTAGVRNRAIERPRLNEFEVDSNPNACAMWDCRSLTETELNELYGAAYQSYANALQSGNAACADMFGRSLTVMSANRVYVGRQAPPQQPNALGGWDVASPHEIYIREDRLSTSTFSGLNTLAHEAEHDYLGPRPSSTALNTWETNIQTLADECESAFYY